MEFKRRKFYHTSIECLSSYEDMISRPRLISGVDNEGYTWENYAQINDVNLNPIHVDHYLMRSLRFDEYFFLRALKCTEYLRSENNPDYVYESWAEVDFDDVCDFGYMSKNEALKAGLRLKNKGLIDIVEVHSRYFCIIYDQYINDVIASFVRNGFDFSKHFPRHTE